MIKWSLMQWILTLKKNNAQCVLEIKKLNFLLQNTPQSSLLTMFGSNRAIKTFLWIQS